MITIETSMPQQPPLLAPRRSRGFTLIEMSVVLVIIALIVGALTVGRDVYRSAAAERLSHDFVQGWILGYDQFVAGVGVVPGDNFDNPSGRVNNGLNNFLCDDQLLNAMLARGVTLPAAPKASTTAPSTRMDRACRTKSVPASAR